MVWKPLLITAPPTARVEVMTKGKPAGIIECSRQFVPKIICELLGNATVVFKSLPNLTLRNGREYLGSSSHRFAELLVCQEFRRARIYLSFTPS